MRKGVYRRRENNQTKIKMTLPSVVVVGDVTVLVVVDVFGGVLDVAVEVTAGEVSVVDLVVVLVDGSVGVVDIVVVVVDALPDAVIIQKVNLMGLEHLV